MNCDSCLLVFKTYQYAFNTGMSIPSDKFDVGIKSKIIDFVERLPKDIFTTCVKQYRKNLNINK